MQDFFEEKLEKWGPTISHHSWYLIGNWLPELGAPQVPLGSAIDFGYYIKRWDVKFNVDLSIPLYMRHFDSALYHNRKPS